MAVLAWVGVLTIVRSSAMAMGSTMGLPFAEFLGAWTLMMAAMMLPAVAPVASLYARSVGPGRIARLAEFASGYLLVWALLGLPAFGAAIGVDALASAHPAVARWGVVTVLVAVAGYELTPLKHLCLDRCRSPLALFLGYASFRGPLRDLRVGAHHGLYCAGCCWPLMLLLVTVGTMNLGAMVALTAVIMAEKLGPWRRVIAAGTAVGALAAAFLFAASPELFARVSG